MPDHDPPDTDVEGEADVEDLAILDIEASVDEVMSVVHWAEDHAGGETGAPERVSTIQPGLVPAATSID
ncbi:MAG: hypothetical protein SWI22_09405 [Pseudomonadota bacterium]|nr:hypothetical protein [Pseudomonadota bacterium]